MTSDAWPVLFFPSILIAAGNLRRVAVNFFKKYYANRNIECLIDRSISRLYFCRSHRQGEKKSVYLLMKRNETKISGNSVKKISTFNPWKTFGQSRVEVETRSGKFFIRYLHL